MWVAGSDTSGHRRACHNNHSGICYNGGKGVKPMAEYHTQKMRALRQRRQQAGLCQSCGERPPVPRLLHCQPCLNEGRARSILRRAQMRQLVLDGYGSRCACCGESEPDFLNLDHVNGQSGDRESEYATYRQAIKEGFPPTFRLLCWNCNCGREKNKDRRCPHETKRSFNRHA